MVPGGCWIGCLLRRRLLLLLLLMRRRCLRTWLVIVGYRRGVLTLRTIVLSVLTLVTVRRDTCLTSRLSWYLLLCCLLFLVRWWKLELRRCRWLRRNLRLNMVMLIMSPACRSVGPCLTGFTDRITAWSWVRVMLILGRLRRLGIGRLGFLFGNLR